MDYFNIKNVKIPKTAALAPMADVADAAFRHMAKRFSAAYVVGEMTSAKGLVYGDKRTAELLRSTPGEYPNAVQLFGSEPDIMAEAVKIALDYAPPIIDINAGCPVNKIVSGGGGSALMKTPKLLGEIVSAAVNAAGEVPVTVKIRIGWDSDCVNAVEVAKIVEAAGAVAVTVHGRTRAQMYTGKADWSQIAAVKNAVSVPVIGNGDVDSAESCAEMYHQTGCDLVMIGRGSFGRPWVFEDIHRYFSTGELSPTRTLSERLAIMRDHAELSVRLRNELKAESRAQEFRELQKYNEYIAMREFRKHAAWYIKGIRGAAALRRQCMSIETLDDLYRLIEVILAENGGV